MLYSDEKTHAGFKTALDEVCQVVRPFPELAAVKDAMDVYKKRHGKEDQRKQQAGSRSVSLLVKTRQGSISDWESYNSCSLRSKRFRAVSGQSGRGRNGIFAFGRAENGSRTKKWKREGEGKERNYSFLSLPPPPSPAPSFTRSIFRAVFLCSGTTRKHLLRRLYQLLHRRFLNNSKWQNNYRFNYTATGYIEIIKQFYSITFYISFLFYAEAFKNMLCF